MGWWTVLLLCVGIPTIVSPAFLVSRDTALQGPETEPRVMKKRSPENVLDQRAIEVQSVTVNCKVASRFAHTVMTSKVVNRANTSQEVLFDVELPKTAFITNFSMEIEGKIYVGEVKEKEKAKEQFEKAVSRGQTAGLVRASGRKMEKFSVSVNIAAHSDVTFMLTYEELLQRQLGQYELMIRVKPKQLVQNFEIIADIYEPQGIAFLDAYGTFVTNELLPLVEKTVTDTKAHVAFRPTVEQQRTCPTCDGTLIDGDLFIKYDLKREKDIGNIQIVNGYFVHFFAPADLPYVQKNIIFVIDISWSMYGKKIAQTREALHTILDDLHEDDHFTLILFDNEIKYWKESLVKATEENVIQAKDFVSKIEARWSTDINQAVLKAVDLLYKDAAENKLPDNSVSMIILLTDGDPTSGVTSPVAILSNVRNAIQGNMTLFCLGFGFNLKYNFLEVMAQQNNGLARRIYEDSDAVLQLTGFYSEVASPLLSEVHLNYPHNAVNRLTQHHFKQFFNGSEIVVAGQVSDDDLQNFIFEVSAQGMNDIKFQGQASAEDWNIIFPEKEYIFGDFTERLWAYLTIQQLLAKRDSGEVEEKANATAEALALSLHYNFVTPLTSMVVTKPQKDETPEEAMIADKLTEDERHRPNYAGIPIPQPAANYHAVTSVDGDPHFIIQVADLNDTLCFNIDDVPGTIFNLVKDPLSGIVVNGQTIGDKKVDPGSKVHTYFGRFGIAHQRLNLEVEVTTQSITVSQDRRKTLLSWSDNRAFRGPGVEIEITKERSLTVTMRDSAKFVIILHRVWKKHPYHRDYLGFYTLDSHLLSSKVHGLLGQFYHGLQFKVGELHAGKDADKLDATMRVKGQQLTVTWGWQRDFRRNVEYGEGVPCWFVHSNGMGLIDGTHHDYVVSEIFKTS
ncbi:inter-alpha-trypsin inhibitor heavy chain H3 [Paramormyrops kingsleyae]|uniref:inter-alpha-trypsin inhibitor heavy chain H3 n=1 Tax=Paramormyrops kingsleyae TaxID=1676925 RepID=UPI003B96DB4F